MKKVKSFNDFIKEEREYDFSHTDSQDSWKVIVPDDQPQQYDKVICTDNTNAEDKLTIGKEYQILGLSSIGDKYYINDDNNKLNYYPIKSFSNEKVLEAINNKEIIESIEEHSETLTVKRMNYHRKEEYQTNKSTSGYLIKTNKRTIKFLIDDEQDCCESWGYFTSEDNLSEFIGKELLSIKVVDDALNITELLLDEHTKEVAGDNDRSTSTMFVNVNTSNGLLQFTAYNNHNGYYGHYAYFIIDNVTKEEKSL